MVIPQAPAAANTNAQDILNKLVRETQEFENYKFNEHVPYFSQQLIVHIEVFSQKTPSNELQETFYRCVNEYINRLINIIPDTVTRSTNKATANNRRSNAASAPVSQSNRLNIATQQTAYIISAIPRLINLTSHHSSINLLNLFVKITRYWLHTDENRNNNSADVKYIVQCFYQVAKLINHQQSYFTALFRVQNIDQLINQKIINMLEKLNDANAHHNTQETSNTLLALGYLAQQSPIFITEKLQDTFPALIQQCNLSSKKLDENRQIVESYYRLLFYVNYTLLNQADLEKIEAALQELPPKPNDFQHAVLKILKNEHVVLEMLVCGFFVDVCFPDKKIIIEFDGKQHYKNGMLCAKDRFRDELLIKAGYKIFRIKNTEAQDSTILETSLQKIISSVDGKHGISAGGGAAGGVHVLRQLAQRGLWKLLQSRRLL